MRLNKVRTEREQHNSYKKNSQGRANKVKRKGQISKNHNQNTPMIPLDRGKGEN